MTIPTSADDEMSRANELLLWLGKTYPDACMWVDENYIEVRDDQSESGVKGWFNSNGGPIGAIVAAITIIRDAHMEMHPEK